MSPIRARGEHRRLSQGDLARAARLAGTELIEFEDGHANPDRGGSAPAGQDSRCARRRSIVRLILLHPFRRRPPLVLGESGMRLHRLLAPRAGGWPEIALRLCNSAGAAPSFGCGCRCRATSGGAHAPAPISPASRSTARYVHPASSAITCLDMTRGKCFQ
jgi:hypothetical protein